MGETSMRRPLKRELGFYPELVGMDRRTAWFEKSDEDYTPEDPHNGVDFVKNNKKPAVFSAGIFGRVSGIGDKSGNNTIRVDAFHAPGFEVCYLHSPLKSHQVKIGDFVGPETPMAESGSEGTANGVHLHIHVIDRNRQCRRMHPGWLNGLCFVNPEAWPIHHHLSGKWSYMNRRDGRLVQAIFGLDDPEYDWIFWELDYKTEKGRPVEKWCRFSGWFGHRSEVLTSSAHPPGRPKEKSEVNIFFGNPVDRREPNDYNIRNADPDYIQIGTSFGRVKLKRVQDDNGID
jgi:hypothetical protein